MHIWLYFLFDDNFRRIKKVLLYYSLQPYRNDFIIEALMDIETNQTKGWHSGLGFRALKKNLLRFAVYFTPTVLLFCYQIERCTKNRPADNLYLASWQSFKYCIVHTIRKEIKCSVETKILHKLVHDFPIFV